VAIFFHLNSGKISLRYPSNKRLGGPTAGGCFQEEISLTPACNRTPDCPTRSQCTGYAVRVVIICSHTMLHDFEQFNYKIVPSTQGRDTNKTKTERECEAAAVGTRMSFLCVPHFCASSILPCLQKNPTLKLWKLDLLPFTGPLDRYNVTIDLPRPFRLKKEIQYIRKVVFSSNTKP
jgi:hypothetical protein